jgi:hypothetical protein
MPSRLEGLPCGEANSPFAFMARGLRIINIDLVGKNGANNMGSWQQ